MDSIKLNFEKSIFSLLLHGCLDHIITIIVFAVVKLLSFVIFVVLLLSQLFLGMNMENWSRVTQNCWILRF